MLKNIVTIVGKIGAKWLKLKRNLGIVSYSNQANVNTPRIVILAEKFKNTFVLCVLVKVELLAILKKDCHFHEKGAKKRVRSCLVKVGILGSQKFDAGFCHEGVVHNGLVSLIFSLLLVL